MSSDESQEIDTSPLDGLMADQGFQMFLVEQITADLQEDVITNQPNTTASDMQSQEISYNQMNTTQPAAPGTQHEQPPNQPIDVQPRPAAPGTQQEQPPIDVQPMPAAPGTQQSSVMYTTGRKRKGYKGETPKAKRSTRSNTLLPNWNKQLDRDNPLL